ncbi:MAG TPA: hypothetical protein VG367_00375 [Mucilaginibacter sp.]|jgi:hypothetical protein|nr:hypothetical protein [Mucilaginibacter sp.]
MNNRLRNTATVLFALVYLFFACAYVILCRQSREIAPGTSNIIKESKTPSHAGEHPPVKNKFTSRPRIILNKKLALLPGSELVLAFCLVFFGAFASPFDRVYHKFSHPRYKGNILQFYCSWRI